METIERDETGRLERRETRDDERASADRATRPAHRGEPAACMIYSRDGASHLTFDNRVTKL